MADLDQRDVGREALPGQGLRQLELKDGRCERTLGGDEAPLHLLQDACGGNRSGRLLTGLDASISMLALSALLICVNFIFVILKLLDAAPSSRAKGTPGKKRTPPCPMNSYVSP